MKRVRRYNIYVCFCWIDSCSAGSVGHKCFTRDRMSQTAPLFCQSPFPLVWGVLCLQQCIMAQFWQTRADKSVVRLRIAAGWWSSRLYVPYQRCAKSIFSVSDSALFLHVHVCVWALHCSVSRVNTPHARSRVTAEDHGSHGCVAAFRYYIMLSHITSDGHQNHRSSTVVQFQLQHTSYSIMAKIITISGRDDQNLIGVIFFTIVIYIKYILL